VDGGGFYGGWRGGRGGGGGQTRPWRLRRGRGTGGSSARERRGLVRPGAAPQRGRAGRQIAPARPASGKPWTCAVSQGRGFFPVARLNDDRSGWPRQVRDCNKLPNLGRLCRSCRAHPRSHTGEQILSDSRVEVIGPRDRLQGELPVTPLQLFDCLRRPAKGHVVLDLDTAECDKRWAGYAPDEAQVVVALVGA